MGPAARPCDVRDGLVLYYKRFVIIREQGAGALVLGPRGVRPLVLGVFVAATHDRRLACLRRLRSVPGPATSGASTRDAAAAMARCRQRRDVLEACRILYGAALVPALRLMHEYAAAQSWGAMRAAAVDQTGRDWGRRRACGRGIRDGRSRDGRSQSRFASSTSSPPCRCWDSLSKVRRPRLQAAIGRRSSGAGGRRRNFHVGPTWK